MLYHPNPLSNLEVNVTLRKKLCYSFWLKILEAKFDSGKLWQLKSSRLIMKSFLSHAVPSADSRRAVVSFWQKNTQVLVNHCKD